MDHSAFPESLKETIYRYLDARQRAQVRPNGCAVLLQHLQEGDWPVPSPSCGHCRRRPGKKLYQALEDQFVFFYKKLNIDNTKELVNEIVKPVEYRSPCRLLGIAGDDLGLAD